MTRIEPPPLDRLPSPARLRRAAAIAAAVAAVLLVVVVLPAERAIDPTGLGTVLGLTEMGMIKQEFKAELAAGKRDREAKRIADSTTAAEKDSIRAVLASGVRPDRVDTTTVTVVPGDEMGVEMQIREKAWIAFAWSTPRGVVNFDVRGDSVGAEDWWYHRYESADSARNGDGIVVSKFTGVLGLYWKNDRDSAVVITVVTRGQYSALTMSKPAARTP